MTKSSVRWKAIKTKSIRGSDCVSLLHENIDIIYKGDLFSQIQAMEVQKPISLPDAIQWIKAEIFECYKDNRLIEAEWNINNFVQWIACKGFHIVLTGEEYELITENELEKPIDFKYLKQFVHRGKHIVKWKAFKVKDQYGYPCDEQMPEIIAKRYQGSLLSKILSMQEQIPILFEDAIKLVCKEADKAFRAMKIGDSLGDYDWYINHFVEYIASLGFHIELTGEEFDLFEALDHVTFN